MDSHREQVVVCTFKMGLVICQKTQMKRTSAARCCRTHDVKLLHLYIELHRVDQRTKHAVNSVEVLSTLEEDNIIAICKICSTRVQREERLQDLTKSYHSCRILSHPCSLHLFFLSGVTKLQVRNFFTTYKMQNYLLSDQYMS